MSCYLFISTRDLIFDNPKFFSRLHAATFYNIGDFLKHETPLAVSRTVSQLSRVSGEKARKSPTAIFPEKPRTETVTWQKSEPVRARDHEWGERHWRVSSDSRKLRHNHRVVTIHHCHLKHHFTLQNTIFKYHSRSIILLDSVSQLYFVFVLTRACSSPSQAGARQKLHMKAIKRGPGACRVVSRLQTPENDWVSSPSQLTTTRRI